MNLYNFYRLSLLTSVTQNPDVKYCNRCRDYTLGIFQTIGFKEFHSYLMLTDEERSTDCGQQLFQRGNFAEVAYIDKT
jgi:hypothetical protein